MKAPFVHTQFLNALKYQTITNRLIQCLAELIQQIYIPSQKTIKIIQSFFNRIGVNLKISSVGIAFQLEPLDKQPEMAIQSLLTGIEKLLASKKKHAIIFLDEFQDIAIADNSADIQSVLRDFVQLTKQVVFFISGSNRRLLESMFNDRNKPFYKLFDHIKLERIDSKAYALFLNKKAKEMWQKELPSEVIEQILFFSENHAYYTNRLCDELWKNKNIPNIDDVKISWENVIQSEFDTIAEDLSHLTKNQRLVLQEVALANFLNEPSSSEVVARVNLSHSSILNAIDVLLKLDYIEKLPQGFHVIDPAIKFILQE